MKARLEETSLLRELRSLLPRLESMVRGQDFDPQRSQERFRLAVRDHASITLIPPLIRRIRSAAPDIRLEVSQWQDRAYEAVIEGKLDAAFSAEHPLSALQSELLFEVDFVCVVGTARSPRLTLAQYLHLPHVVVETWAGEQTPVDRPLAQFGAKRRVVLSVPFFAAAMFTVAKLSGGVAVDQYCSAVLIYLWKFLRTRGTVCAATPQRQDGLSPQFYLFPSYRSGMLGAKAVNQAGPLVFSFKEEIVSWAI
jgi:DNA-binding transcriptional LysR family regulator